MQLSSHLRDHPRASELVFLAKERDAESQAQLAALLEELGLPADSFEAADDTAKILRKHEVLIGDAICAYEVIENVMQIRKAIPFAGKLIAQANRIDQWKPSTQVDSERGAYTNANRTSKWQKITEGAFTGLYTELCSLLWEAAGFYRCWNPYVVVRSGLNWDIVRYDVGDRFATHVDAIASTQWQSRQLAALVYLNDDFEGGETRFCHPGPEITIKPEAGKVALFPPFHTHPHEGLPVTSGTKYVALGWFYP
jgi:hypothetical protein